MSMVVIASGDVMEIVLSLLCCMSSRRDVCRTFVCKGDG